MNYTNQHQNLAAFSAITLLLVSIAFTVFDQSDPIVILISLALLGAIHMARKQSKPTTRS
ncbi:MAG: hypothetical protein WC761_05090 [Candidatus Paceibacterota bacterium]